MLVDPKSVASLFGGADRRTAAGGARTTYLAEQLEQAIRAELDAKTREHGLTALCYTTPVVLDRRPGMFGAQLARRSFVSAQAGSELIATLLRKELISREPDSANQRILRISLTLDVHAVVEACEASGAHDADVGLGGAGLDGPTRTPDAAGPRCR